ncbi:WXG100 family type VII secretion target [Streptomyces sp. NPDC052396]|uniref:WXG100 family type VII secretion target n=1 Tax=Streptomyces sp. NPDC052396 TaxID=3365689 RepID=UPI0037D8343D
MSGKQKISDDAFTTFTKSIDDAIDHFNQNVQKLQHAITIVEGNWKGEAFAAFQRAHQELTDDHRAVNNKIQHIREAVAKTHTMGGANDADVASTLKSVSGLDQY